MNPTQERHYIVIPHASELRALFLPGESGWTLPEVFCLDADFWLAPQVNRDLWTRFAMQATVRREVAVLLPPTSPQVTFIYLVENHTPAWQPPAGARWVGHAELSVLPLARPEHRPLLEAWFAWESSDGGTTRAPWFRIGWYRQAVDWIHAQLAALALVPLGPVEQLRSWQRSMVLRIATDRGTVYFKAVPAFFAHELTLAQYLHAQHPAHFPRLLAADLDRHWMLLEDVGAHTLADVADIACYEEALRLYAQVQIEQTGHTGQLLALGCPDRRPEVIAAEMDDLLADTPAMFPGEPYGLSAAEIQALTRAAPRLKAICRELAAFRVPCTLEHGDLWARQISVRDGHPVLMDWSDASISHPFFSPGFFTDLDDQIFLTREIAGRYLATLPNARERLRAAYLEPWTIYEPMERLLAAYALAQTLAGVHYALLYRQIILPGMELKWEMERMLPFHLRKVVRRICAEAE